MKVVLEVSDEMTEALGHPPVAHLQQLYFLLVARFG